MALQKNTGETPDTLAQSITIKQIEDKEVEPYLKRLNNRLSNLSVVLDREGDSFVNPHLTLVRNSISGLLLKHRLHGLDRVDFSFTICPYQSGFPTEKDFYILGSNKEEAPSILEALPSRDDIIDRIRSGILRGGSIVNAQIMLHRYNLAAMLSSSPLLEGYNFEKPKFVQQKGERRLYTLGWNAIERATKLPVFYRMCVEQDARMKPLEEISNPRLELLLYQTQMGFSDLGVFARQVDREIEEIHPKLLERFTIGPYYDPLTMNTPTVEAILSESDDPSLLKFTKEAVYSERTKPYGTFWDRVMRRKTERQVFGPVDRETKLIVPFGVKQILKGRDEYGQPCQVYGVSKDGEVLG